VTTSPADADLPARAGGISRRTRVVIVAAEGVVAAIVGGVAIGGTIGWIVVGLAIVSVPVLLVVAGRARRGRAGIGAPGSAEFLTRLRVLAVQSRSSGEVGVVSDGQGYAAGVEVEVRRGADLDLDLFGTIVAADPSRPSALQVRTTLQAPPVATRVMGAIVLRRREGSVAVQRRVHILLRLEPTWAGDVVESHGGGARGSRAALVAAVDRFSARLRREGIANRVLDAAAASQLLAEDSAPGRAARTLAADPGSPDDVARLTGLLAEVGPERGVFSVCIDLASSDQWQTFAALHVAARNARECDTAAAALLADPAVRGETTGEGIAAIVPLGGGPGDLASVLTLARA